LLDRSALVLQCAEDNTFGNLGTGGTVPNSQSRKPGNVPSVPGSPIRFVILSPASPCAAGTTTRRACPERSRRDLCSLSASRRTEEMWDGWPASNDLCVHRSHCECPILAFFARACPEPVDGVGGDASSTRAPRLEIGKGTSSLVPINDPFEDPASAVEDFEDRRERL
jgi:hypothetical protein